MKISGLLLVLAVVAPGLAVAQPRTSPSADTVKAIRTVLRDGCMPLLLKGVPLQTALGKVARPVTYAGGPAMIVMAPEPVLAAKQRNSCYIRVEGGDGGALRRTMIDEAAKLAGKPLKVVQDGGPDARNQRGRYRQELHCFILEGKPAEMIISSSDDGSSTALQVSFLFDSPTNRCSRPG